MTDNDKFREYKRMTEGKLYNPSDKYLNKKHMQGFIRCEKFNRIPIWRTRAKQRALEKLIPSSKGNNLRVVSPFYCEYGENIHIGKDCFINLNCIFSDVSPITLGNEVFIGFNVVMATPNHPFAAEERVSTDYPDGKYELEYSEPIVIKDRCWICSSSTICGGVTVGENSIVAAGSVVVRDVPPNSIVAGVPARVVRRIDEKDIMNVWETYVKDEIPLSVRNKAKV